jgi:DNA-binding NarL/FixJ family response regulator
MLYPVCLNRTKEAKICLTKMQYYLMKTITRLVIADDSPRARHGQRALLTIQPGIEIVGEAADGAEAVRLVEAVQPDGVILDVRMPGMDGLEASRLIKDRWPEIRVIVLSVDAIYREEALAAGADAFLVKGCSTKELLEAIGICDYGV